MNWAYSDCLKTADRHVFFKFMVKTLAEKKGLRATFMPKPFLNKTGNGCHSHISLWNKKGQNIFLNKKDELGLSTCAYNFIGGIMHSTEALSAWFNPTINSFKRINAKATQSGATWSPNSISFSGNNRTHLIRVPDSGRFELRLMDGAVNPYLLQAGTIAAGLDGIKSRRKPGKRFDNNMYEEYNKIDNLKKLPKTLDIALTKFSKSEVMQKAFSKKTIQSYIKLKNTEIKRFKLSKNNKIKGITKWERTNTIDC